MDDALLVRRLDRLGDLLRDPNHLLDRHRPLLDTLRERLAFHQLHDQEALAVDLFETEDPGDVGVGQRRQNPGLALETREPLRVLGETVREHLEGHVAAELGVFRTPHLPHPALAQFRSHLVVRNIAADHPHSFNIPPIAGNATCFY